MDTPVKFKRLTHLASELNEKLNALQLGQLNKEELEALTEQSRELYERLVVLRFKAYDGEVRGVKENTEEKPFKEETPVTSSFSFSINSTSKTEVTPNQVSLIDAIEEFTKSEIPSIEETKEEPMLIAHLPSHNEMATTINHTPSLHDVLAQNIGQKESLAEKLENTPIQDLKKAITLNQRFQFSKELFKGNNQDYEVTIDRINTTSREEAMRTIENLRSKYSWSDESQVAQDFTGLVERRFL